MLENNYYKQIINAFINQNAHTGISYCLSDDISYDTLGKYICAMANTAVIKQEPYIYAFWGVDSNKNVIGSDFIAPAPQELARHLSSNVEFKLVEVFLNSNRTIVLEVQKAFGSTIQYDGIEFVIDENEQPVELIGISQDAEKLWGIINSQNDNFASKIALKNVSSNEVMQYLDCESFFQLLERPLPNNPLSVMSTLSEFKFIVEQNTGKYNITNLGALLLARRISLFETVTYKAIRVLIYSGNNNTAHAHEQIGGKGYLVGFSGLIKYIQEHIPKMEYIDGAIRKHKDMFPIISIRELVANAIIHQDLNEKGSPIISIFDDHIVISNPGIPIIEKERFIDNPPYSRNESLAAAMHKAGICEERGSGYDKVVTFIEENNLPAPEITIHERRTSVTLWKEKSFDQLSKDELIQICYSHTCLNYVQGKPTNNASLRARFNLSEEERYKISRAFKPTVIEGLIKEKEGTGPKNREYIPFWA